MLIRVSFQWCSFLHLASLPMIPLVHVNLAQTTLDVCVFVVRTFIISACCFPILVQLGPWRQAHRHLLIPSWPRVYIIEISTRNTIQGWPLWGDACLNQFFRPVTNLFSCFLCGSTRSLMIFSMVWAHYSKNKCYMEWNLKHVHDLCIKSHSDICFYS
jgi:hypothetical protein